MCVCVRACAHVSTTLVSLWCENDFSGKLASFSTGCVYIIQATVVTFSSPRLAKLIPEIYQGNQIQIMRKRFSPYHRFSFKIPKQKPQCGALKQCEKKLINSGYEVCP